MTFLLKFGTMYLSYIEIFVINLLLIVKRKDDVDE